MKRKITFVLVMLVLVFCILALFTKKSYDRYTLNRDLISQITRNTPTYTPLEKIPESLKKAIIATEDSRYYYHIGFDLIGITRAVITNVKCGSYREGGSTITQQLAKNLFLSKEKKFSRKVKELFLAIELERLYTKNEILEMYINVIYYGSGAYGIGEASQVYFKKPPEALTLEESAMLAGLLKAPSLYNPKENLKKALSRQKIVLDLMEKQGYISNKLLLINIAE